MTPRRIRLILGRPERPAVYDGERFRNVKVLVTGAAGSIGEPLCARLRSHGADVYPTDVDSMDVRDFTQTGETISRLRPDIIFHLAAQKYAPEGEEEPWETTRTNITGTLNIASLADYFDAHLVAASTCKAIEPETVYGATKLVAERLVLNMGGTVVRLYNVVPAAGNVFETWDETPDPVPVTGCSRYFISQDEAVHALLAAATLEPGRYSPDPGEPRKMWAVAQALGRQTIGMPIRRGDRIVEPLVGTNEKLAQLSSGLRKVTGPHDMVPEGRLIA